MSVAEERGEKPRAEASGRVEAECPAAFPGWLKRMVPPLEAEETNHLYEAFRRRRMIHRIRRRFWLERIQVAGFPLGRLIGPVLFVGLILLTLIYVRSPAALILFLPAFVLLRIVQRVARMFMKESTPAFLHKTFRGDGVAPNLALDLYQAGARGRDVAEGIFLELFERYWPGVLINLLILVAVGTFLLFMFQPEWNTAVIFAVLAFLFLLGEMAASLWISLMARVTVRNLRDRLDFWGAETFSDRVLAVSRRVGVGILGVVGMIFGSWFLVAGIIVLATTQQRARQTEADNFFLENLISLSTALVLIAVGVALHLFRRKIRERNIKKYERTLDLADGAFDSYMRRKVLNDWEG